MTAAEYRSRLFKLHPDTNGADHSRVGELAKLICEWRLTNRSCACGCGRKLNRTQARRGTLYARYQCANMATGNTRRKRMMLTSASTDGSINPNTKPTTTTP